MKNQLITAIAIGIIAMVHTVEAGIKNKMEVAEEQMLMAETLEKEQSEMVFMASFETEPSVFIYDAEGNLVHEYKKHEWNEEAVRKIIKKCDFMAEVDASYYYLLN